MTCTEYVVSKVFRYDTPKELRIRNWLVASIYRVLQVGILLYILVSIILGLGYQDTDEVVSAATARVTGVAYTNITDNPNLNVEDVTPYNRIWDPADYVIPPVLDNAFFVMTNMIITPEQYKGRCAEDPSMLDVECQEGNSTNCVKGQHVTRGNGVKTGECVTYTFTGGSTTDTCEIEAWCPVEYTETPVQDEAVLLEAENFTVLIKNSIRYPKFDFQKQNIAKDITDADLKNCNYNKNLEPSCPVFSLGYIVQEAGENFTELAYQGGVIGIFIKWNCNLDKNWDACQPEYSFRRLDNIRQEDASTSLGYNFRFGKFYVKNGIEYRTLTRAYGILFEIIVSGTAGKFDIITFGISLGAGIGLFSLANLLCDFITFTCLKRKWDNLKYNSMENVAQENNPVQNTAPPQRQSTSQAVHVDTNI